MRISDWSSDVCSSDLPEMVSEVLDVMTALAKDGMTMMVVTHEMGFARKVADRIVFMEDGAVIDDISTTEFFAGKPSGRASAFLSKILNRSEERRVGKECVSTCRSRWSP